MNCKEITYKNYGRCLEMTNGTVELVVTLDLGPRIIRYGFCGKDNMLYEDIARESRYEKEDLKEMFGEKAVWYNYGGHRLWIAPETTETYFPDNNPVDYEISEEDNTVYFSCDIQEQTGLQFTTVVTLQPEGSDVKITHFITNCSGESLKFAPWAITVLDRGGVEIIPWNDTDTVLLPNRTVRAWPYTNFADHRLNMGKKFMTLSSDTTDQAIKLGVDLEKGTVAYINKGMMFVKSFRHYPDTEYPDNGCSLETYTCKIFLECETLGEYGSKPDGSTVSHTEYWSLYDNVTLKDPKDEAELEKLFDEHDLI